MNENRSYSKFQWVVILIAHLALLYWILIVLQNAGVWERGRIFAHFAGFSIYGGLLIRTCAYLAKRRYLRETNNEA